MDINSVIGACRESLFLSLVPSIMEFILYSYCYNVCIFPTIELESCIYNCPAESIKLSWIFSIQNSLHIVLSIWYQETKISNETSIQTSHIFLRQPKYSASLFHYHTTRCFQHHRPNKWETHPLHISTVACPIWSSPHWLWSDELCHRWFIGSIIRWHSFLHLSKNSLG